MTTLQFREWSTAGGVDLTAAHRNVLRNRFDATVQVSPGDEQLYDVTPGNVVGAVRVDGVTVIVEPKMPISRVLFMLGYAACPAAIGQDDAEVGPTTDLVSAVALLFTRLVERSLRRGLLFGYHAVDASSYTVRGRIDLAEQLRLRPGQNLPLAISYQEYDEDLLENRLLLAAALSLRRMPLRDASARRSLHRLCGTLQNVTAVDFRGSLLPEVTWTRLNQHVRAPVEFAKLLLQKQAPDLRGGAVQMPSLTFNMADVFEAFVRVALREALGLSESQFPSGDRCPKLFLDEQGVVRLKPDLSLWRTSRCSFVGDVKYKRDGGVGHNDDLYQLLAYATAAGLQDATLIYALGPTVGRTHSVHGTDKRLHVRYLDLSQPPSVLLGQVAALAKSIEASLADA